MEHAQLQRSCARSQSAFSQEFHGGGYPLPASLSMSRVVRWLGLSSNNVAAFDLGT